MLAYDEGVVEEGGSDLGGLQVELLAGKGGHVVLQPAVTVAFVVPLFGRRVRVVFVVGGDGHKVGVGVVLEGGVLG